VAGRLKNCRYCRVLLVIMTLALVATVLASANVWNPLPSVAAWWAKFTQLSDPPPPWNVRASGVPDVAAVMSSGQVVVASRGFVDVYRLDTGQAIKQEVMVYWALPAVDVVVARLRPENPDRDPDHNLGYAVIDPSTWTTLWSDRESKAVWAFADVILDLACPAAGPCQLRAHGHRSGAVLWSVALPSNARTISGADPQLAGPRDPSGWFAGAAEGTPDLLPAVIGLPIDGKIQVIDTVEGRLVREMSAPNRQTRVAIVGERILLSGAAPGGAGCRFWVEALNYRTGSSQWRTEGLDLDTASGIGCEQRRDPLGSGRQLVAVSGGNAPVIVSADTGAPVWAGVPGDRVLATDGELAVVQDADRKTVRVLDLIADGAPAVWSAQLGLSVRAAVTRTMVIIRDNDKATLTVLSHRPVNQISQVKTTSDVVGYGPRGILLASGRRIGILPLAT
jgi:outer membrane protein assembly factor BamB